jgi:hypothetical protein
MNKFKPLSRPSTGKKGKVCRNRFRASGLTVEVTSPKGFCCHILEGQPNQGVPCF